MRKKILVILLCCLVSLLLAAGGAVWWAARHMRTPEFRAQLSQLVKNATGREVSLEGDLSITVFPWFGLKARGLSLGNDLAFGETPLLTAREIGARIKVLPLFERRLVFDTVEMVDAALTLTMDAEGRGNWEGMLEHMRAQENATELTDSTFRKVTVRGLRLINSQARLDDHQHNHSYIATGIDLRTGRIEAATPLPFTVFCDFSWPRPGLVAHLEGTGKLHWSKDDPEPIFTETLVQGDIGGTFMPQSAPRAGISTTVTLEQGRHLKLSNTRLRLIGADVKGEVTFLDVTELFHLESKLELGSFSPHSVINAYWPGTIAHDFQAVLQKAQGPLNISATVDELVFETPGFSLDGGALKGRVRMGFDEVSGLDFDLAANHLDADACIAAFTSNATSAPLVVSDLPLDYLRQVKGAGRLAVDSLKFVGVPGQKAEVSWQGGGGQHRVQLKPLKMQPGSVVGEFSASFGLGGAAPGPGGKDGAGKQPGPPALSLQPGQPGQAVLGWACALRLDDADARQVPWLNRFGPGVTGLLDLRLKAEAQKAPAQGTARLSQVVRRAAGEVSANVSPATLEWAADRSQPKAPPRGMNFSSLAAHARFVPAAAGEADWALQLDGGLSAVGTRPLLNLDAKLTGLLRSQQGRVQLTGASASGRLKGWFLPRKENEASFSGKGSLDFAGQKLNLSAMSVQTSGLSLLGPLAGTQVLSADWTLTGRIRCQEGDPKRVLSVLDIRVPKSADKRVLQRLTGEADLTVSGKGAALANLNAQLDDTSVRGSYSVQNFDAPRQNLALACGSFDLDRYLAAPEPVRRGGPREPRPAPEPLPVDSLRDLNLEGSLGFRSFKFKGLTTRELKATVSAKSGSLLVKPMSGNFYGGALSGEFTAQVAQNAMQTRLSLAAKDFQAGPFMLGWAGKELVTGRTDLFLDVGGVGATDTEVLRTMEGMAGFKITDGSYSLSGGAEPAPAAKRPPPGATPQHPVAHRRPGTPFSQASARLKVAQGVFQCDDFRLDGPGMVLTGKGRFSPAEDSINLNLTASMSGTPDVPIKVFGRLRDPEMEIPTGVLIGNAIMEILGLPLKPIKFFKDLLF